MSENYIVIILYPLLLFLTTIISKKLRFVDKPGSRKIHKQPTPNISGICLYLLLFYLISTNETSYEVEIIIAAGSMIILVGFLDDRKNLTPGVKFCFIAIPIIYLMLNGFTLQNLGEYEKIGLLNLGKFSSIFTFLAVGLLVNSFNYIDGIDGLLIGITITSISYFIFLIGDASNFLILFYYLIYGLVINLFFNILTIKSGFKSFMGDAGSLFLGFLISFLMIFLFIYINIHPAYLIWAVWYPVFDFLFVSIYRLIKNKDITSPDKNHFHHLILSYFNGNHIKTSVLINVLNLIIIMIGYFFTLEFGKIYSLLLFTLLFILFFMLRKKLIY